MIIKKCRAYVVVMGGDWVARPSEKYSRVCYDNEIPRVNIVNKLRAQYGTGMKEEPCFKVPKIKMMPEATFLF